MADTKPDISISHLDWVDVYSLNGTVVGTSLIIQNKGSSTVTLYESATKPVGAATNLDGVDLVPYALSGTTANVTDTPTGLWAITRQGFDGILNVQEV